VQKIETPQAVALVLDGHWRVRATGEEMQVRAANLFRFEDGRVAAYEIYPDSFTFAQAIGRA
uniref:nuclear transport factor 2 family protein n=1 Tax=Klebsiella pneumoniae TaxID=573 RepID=UPI001953BD3C